ncbi:Ail/Lom family outer membrane beta-barrel protein, partial [Escherichia coli]|nr:Ail/Lom family outer membrane beta-barrel protein [Escherichia coli]
MGVRVNEWFSAYAMAG